MVHFKGLNNHKKIYALFQYHVALKTYDKKIKQLFYVPSSSGPEESTLIFWKVVGFILILTFNCKRN